MDGTGTCFKRCFFGQVATPADQLTTLASFSVACGADNWKEAGATILDNWCDGYNTNLASSGSTGWCEEDVVYDPCTGELLQTKTTGGEDDKPR